MIEQLQQLQLKDYRVVAALVTLLVGYRWDAGIEGRLQGWLELDFASPQGS